MQAFLQTTRGKLILGGVAGVLALCCICGVIGSITNGSNTSSSSATSAAIASGATTASASTEAPTDAPTTEPTAQPTDAPPPTAEPTQVPTPEGPAPVGTRLDAGGTALTVVSAERTAAAGQYQKAEAGNVYLILEVLIENTGDKANPYNPLYFKAKDSDGYEYNSTILLEGQSLKSGELQPGDKARGLVGIEIKEGSKGVVVSYKPIVIFDTSDPFQVAIPD